MALCEAGGRAERFFRTCGLCVDRKATFNAACAGGVCGVFPRSSRWQRGAAGSASRPAAFVQNEREALLSARRLLKVGDKQLEKSERGLLAETR